MKFGVSCQYVIIEKKYKFGNDLTIVGSVNFTLHDSDGGLDHKNDKKTISMTQINRFIRF